MKLSQFMGGFISTSQVFGSHICSVGSNNFSVTMFLLLDMFLFTLICLYDARVANILGLEIDVRTQREIARVYVNETIL